ncbi:c-type cytochrome [Polymorphum gilvum]|uniref:Cytochrome c domain-containing protein n=1 Tax=Polymorphum gilvum (strain LMG 25793 / CGMCC 1.9160 / SL003B-26A1) TaxID=991905 RepID=F2J4A8_POLGS|nr:cytochrome c [Polymorphum gilvum]ADZ71050.1 hypothetical protein SL003B_2627 [Polymorphum gilvum SL003B-26A1]
MAGGIAALVAGSLALLVVAAPAGADEAARRGEAVVEQWCRMCHLRADQEPDPDLAPPYEDIVMIPGRDRAYFERFLEEDHFPMTTFRLFDHEKADVVAYLLALQERERRRQSAR